MKWYLPSFNGDFRFEEANEGQFTRVSVERPTPAEQEVLRRWAEKTPAIKAGDLERLMNNGAIEIEAPLFEVAAPMAKLLNAGKVGLLTALSFESGRTHVTEVIEKLPAWMKKREGREGPAKAAVTVTRPKLCCPECSGRPEGERKACDVLWEFLDPVQRMEWIQGPAGGQRITAFGGLTGHAYDLRPRTSPVAAQRGRICFDMDDKLVLHNFNLDVPPEEELLAAKLILEHRENWLRVEGEVDPVDRAAPGTIFVSPLPPVYR
jgi:hypothetical protein